MCCMDTHFFISGKAAESNLKGELKNVSGNGFNGKRRKPSGRSTFSERREGASVYARSWQAGALARSSPDCDGRFRKTGYLRASDCWHRWRIPDERRSECRAVRATHLS